MSNLISSREKHLLNTHIHARCFHGNQAATLLFNSGWVSRGRWLLCRVCLGGQGGGSRGVGGWGWRANIKQRTRQMKALHILKSNHNLVITRRWYDQNKEGNRQDWQDRERPECMSQGKGDVRLLLDGKWWSLMDRDGLFPKVDAYLLHQSLYPGTGTEPKRISKAQVLHCNKDSGVWHNHQYLDFHSFLFLCHTMANQITKAEWKWKECDFLQWIQIFSVLTESMKLFVHVKMLCWIECIWNTGWCSYFHLLAFAKHVPRINKFWKKRKKRKIRGTLKSTNLYLRHVGPLSCDNAAERVT